MGPFAIRDQFPVKLLFLSLRPEGAALLPENAWRFSVGFAYTNTYAVTRPVGNPRVASDYYQAAPADEYRLFVDAEVLHLTLDLDWRIAHRLQAGVTLPILLQSGGFLDRTVEGFHRLFRLSNGGREETPRNAYGVFVVRSGQFWIARDDAPRMQPGDVVLRLKHPVFVSAGAWPSVSWLNAVKLPTGRFEHLTGSGGTDLQMALLVTQPVGRRLAAHYNLAHTRLGKPARHAGFPVRSVLSQMLAIEYLATPRLSVLVQALSNTSLFPESALGPLDRTAYELHAGVKYAVSPSTRFEIGLMENLSQYQNTPDIGLHAGVSMGR
jgi:hypothetical protein